MAIADRCIPEPRGTKRLSFGRIANCSGPTPIGLAFHSCSTLAGSAGSPVVDPSTGTVVGIHSEVDARPGRKSRFWACPSLAERIGLAFTPSPTALSPWTRREDETACTPGPVLAASGAIGSISRLGEFVCMAWLIKYDGQLLAVSHREVAQVDVGKLSLAFRDPPSTVQAFGLEIFVTDAGELAVFRVIGDSAAIEKGRDPLEISQNPPRLGFARAPFSQFFPIIPSHSSL